MECINKYSKKADANNKIGCELIHCDPNCKITPSNMCDTNNYNCLECNSPYVLLKGRCIQPFGN